MQAVLYGKNHAGVGGMADVAIMPPAQAAYLAHSSVGQKAPYRTPDF